MPKPQKYLPFLGHIFLGAWSRSIKKASLELPQTFLFLLPLICKYKAFRMYPQTSLQSFIEPQSFLAEAARWRFELGLLLLFFAFCVFFFFFCFCSSMFEVGKNWFLKACLMPFYLFIFLFIIVTVVWSGRKLF